jgi:tetratricopeptide (TPR) repeat protein
MDAAAEAIYNDQDGDTALEYIEQALAHVPDQPDILDMKVLTLMMADRQEEADDLLRRHADLHPDHFNARTTRANLALREGDLDAAQVWLDPLLQRDRLTTDEFSTLANTQIRLLMLRGEIEGAMSWVRMWQSIDPDAVPPLYTRLADMVDHADSEEINGPAVREFVEGLIGELDGELLSRLDAILTEENLDMLFDTVDDD